MANIGTLAVNVVARTSRFTRKMGLASKSLGLLRTTAIAASVGTAILGTGLVAAAKSHETLNRSMNRSLSIMGDVSDAMRNDMTSAAIEVSRTTNASAKQAADAYFFLASAGLDAEQSLRALPTVSKFAQAGNFDLARATDLLTDAQSALGLTVKDSTKNMLAMKKVSDVLVKANTLANASVQQFSESLTNKAGASLKIVGKDIEEGVAVLAAFADQGIKGAESGTGLGIVMRDLQTKAIKNASTFRKAGVSVFDVTGKMRNMGDIIENLENKLRGLSDQAKKTFLLDLGFSDKSVIFVQTLLGTSQKIKDYETALRSAGGTTAKVADKMLTPMEKALNKLSASWTKLGESMEKPVLLTAHFLEGLNRLTPSGIGGAIADVLGSPVQSDADVRASVKVDVDRFLKFRPKKETHAERRAGEMSRARERFNAIRSPSLAERNKAIVDKFSAFNAGKEFWNGFRSQGIRSLPGRAVGHIQQIGGVLGKQAQLGGLALRGAALREELKALNQRQVAGSLVASRTGSAESFRQQAQNRRIRQQQKNDLKRNTLLERIEKNTQQQQLLQVGF